MSRKTPLSTLQRFHPAAFNPLETAEPVSQAFTKAPKSAKLVRRESQIRRDSDSVKGISITLYDIDFAIKRYIEEKIKPYITENGRKIPVPVQYGSPEKWTSMQKLAALRDGKSKSIYAPSMGGQIKCLTRTYEAADIDPATIGLVEAHGTGTKAGDACEVDSLKAFFGQFNIENQSIPLGSIKSQIGHTRMAAGVASLIKTSLALHHKILPATINVETPNPALGLDKSPFYVNNRTKPWINNKNNKRTACVSSFVVFM